MQRNSIEVSSKTIKRLKSIKLKKKLNSYDSLIEYLLWFYENEGKVIKTSGGFIY